MRPRPECEPMARGWGDSVAGLCREGRTAPVEPAKPHPGEVQTGGGL